MPVSPIVLTLMFLGLAVCALALIKGGRAERITAALILANLLLAYLGQFLPPSGDSIFQLARDGLTALAFLVVTLIWGTPWLGMVMLLYASQFALHSVYFVTDRPHDRLHSIANNINFLSVHLCLLIGTVIAWRKSARQSKSPAES